MGMFGGEKRKYGVVAAKTRRFSFSNEFHTKNHRGGHRELTRRMATQHPEYWLTKPVMSVKGAWFYEDTVHEVPELGPQQVGERFSD